MYIEISLEKYDASKVYNCYYVHPVSKSWLRPWLCRFDLAISSLVNYRILITLLIITHRVIDTFHINQSKIKECRGSWAISVKLFSMYGKLFKG